GSTIVQTSTIVISIAVGVVVTVLSAALPARRASKVAPIAAMRDVALDRSATSKRRTATGLLMSGLGVAALVRGLSATDVALVWEPGGVSESAAFTAECADLVGLPPEDRWRPTDGFAHAVIDRARNETVHVSATTTIGKFFAPGNVKGAGAELGVEGMPVK